MTEPRDPQTDPSDLDAPEAVRAERPRTFTNGVIAMLCGLFVVTMVGAAFAAVPLYRMFCQVTGFGGTPSRVESQAGIVPIDRKINVRFDANVSGGLRWRFAPEVEQVTLRMGDVATVQFVAENLTDKTITATSTFNVTPTVSGGYFSKITCFCFTEQTLKPYQKRELPVVFYVDPAMDKDQDAVSVRDITLSYTFFPAAASTKPVAAEEAGRGTDGKS